MMKFAVVVLLAVVACANGLNIGTGPYPRLILPDPYIVGGHNAIAGQFPHQITMQTESALGVRSHRCGGSILNARWILTAAHCVVGSISGKLVIVAGDHQLSVNEGTEQESEVAETFVHELYPADPVVAPYDIALLRLSTPFTLNDRVKAIALPTSGAIPSGTSTLSGWGSMGFFVMPDTLQTVDMPIVPFNECLAAYGGDTVEDTNVCTGPMEGGISACSGDSGGPLIQGSAVIGIVSWGTIPCGSVNAPSVYTRVSAYNDWILERTGPL